MGKNLLRVVRCAPIVFRGSKAGLTKTERCFQLSFETSAWLRSRLGADA